MIDFDFFLDRDSTNTEHRQVSDSKLPLIFFLTQDAIIDPLFTTTCPSALQDGLPRKAEYRLP